MGVPIRSRAIFVPARRFSRTSRLASPHEAAACGERVGRNVAGASGAPRVRPVLSLRPPATSPDRHARSSPLRSSAPRGLRRPRLESRSGRGRLRPSSRSFRSPATRVRRPALALRPVAPSPRSPWPRPLRRSRPFSQRATRPLLARSALRAPVELFGDCPLGPFEHRPLVPDARFEHDSHCRGWGR